MLRSRRCFTLCVNHTSTVFVVTVEARRVSQRCITTNHTIQVDQLTRSEFTKSNRVVRHLWHGVTWFMARLHCGRRLIVALFNAQKAFWRCWFSVFFQAGRALFAGLQGSTVMDLYRFLPSIEGLKRSESDGARIERGSKFELQKSRMRLWVRRPE